jgi:trehalose 6-phosphate synthase
MAARESDAPGLPPEICNLIAGRRIIVASNRGPVEFHRDPGGRLTTKRGSGGVVTALASLAASLPLTWVAATMSEGDRAAFPDASAPAREVRLGHIPLRVRYVAVAPEVYARHYDSISNQVLWFLQHYLWDPASSPTFTDREYTAWDEGYRAVNFAIAQAVAGELLAPEGTGNRRQRPGDGSDAIVLMQDYHLYLAAAFLRQRLPRAIIQQFIHIPWPSVRYWRFLPQRFLTEIYEGLAANDALGFQTERDARAFLECARALLPGCRVDLDEGRLLWRRHRLVARAYPVTADADEIRRTLHSTPARRGAEELAPFVGDGVQVIVRVDRIEPTKNIVRGFQAYELLLRRYPELHGKVRHLAFLVPSRQGLAVYRRYEREVRRAIQRINERFGTPEWQPVKAFFENNRARALAALRRYDVLLVNAVIDGMNLVAKEGALANSHDGVIILSRTAGAYIQMADAVLPVTSTDLEETADQLYEALTMSESERRQRCERARDIVARDTLAGWIADQLRDAVLTHPQRLGTARGAALARVRS